MTKRKAPEDKLKTGRPDTYDPKVATRICELIATNSAGIKTICKQNPDIPGYDAIYGWILRHPEFAEQYKKARELQQEVHVNEMLEIANDESNDMIQTEKGWVGNPTSIARAKLKIDTLKWHASKLAPKVYGDKTQQEITIMSHEDALKELE